MNDDIPPRLGRRLFYRALLACTAIVLLTATAISSAGMLQIDDILDELPEGRVAIPLDEDIDRADAGGPRTIMVLGSDARYGADKRDRRADTIILVRLDPDKEATTIMSIPRDLKVRIPGIQYEDRINAAFANGGAKLTLKTVKELLSFPGEPFEVNHVVQIDFGGFRRAVDYIGGVYVDVDRDYFNDRGGNCDGCYATIDIDAGYQKLKGQDALDYVRYRHGDNDLVRAARQQDFLRQLKHASGVRKRLTFSNRKEIVRLIGRYTNTDRGLSEKATLLSVLKLGLYTADKPIEEVRFGAGKLEDEGGIYLRASESALRETVDDFMNARVANEPKAELEATEEEKRFTRKARKGKKTKLSDVPGMEVVKKEGEDMAIVSAPKMKFPFYFPTLRPVGARYGGTEPRVYTIKDEVGNRRQAYRIWASLGIAGEYYGVQGMQWKDPPILDGPHDERRINGRTYLVYYDGRRVRMVAWKTKRGTYYVSNTLVRTLSSKKMLAIASSLRRLGG